MIKDLLLRALDSTLVYRLLDVFDRRSENRMTEYGMLAQAFEFAKINGVKGDYFEFGVWRGKTFCHARRMAKKYRVSPMKFYAFDSFEGLPEVAAGSEYEIWEKGQFACSQEDFKKILVRAGFHAQDYELVPGFYDSSLDDALRQRLHLAGVKASIIYIDCDLYESTRSVLNFVGDFVQDGTIICFDDYYNYRGLPGMGEQRAIAEFLERRRDINLQPYFPYSPLGMSYIVSLRRTSFE